MNEHFIRLRRGWEVVSVDPPRRVDLPIVWPEDFPRSIVLRRRFQTPRIDAERETLVLRFEAIAGTVSLRLNGQVITPSSPPPTTIREWIWETPRPGGNVLEIDVDLGGHSEADARRSEPWGGIALVVRRDG